MRTRRMPKGELPETRFKNKPTIYPLIEQVYSVTAKKMPDP